MWLVFFKLLWQTFELFLLFSLAFVSSSLLSHGLQHTRLPCSSSSPGVCPSSFSLYQWCCPVISSSDVLFSFCPQSFPASETFPMSHLFTSDDQNTGVSTSASVFPVNIQGWSPWRLTGLNSLLSQGLLGAFFSTMVWRHQFFDILPSLWSSSYNHTWPLGRPQPWLIQTFVGRVMSLLFNTLSRFVITFPAKKQSSSDFMATVTIYSDFGVWEGETCHYFHLFPFVCCAATGADAVILVLPREKQMTHGRTISKSVAQVLVFVCVVSKNMICQ